MKSLDNAKVTKGMIFAGCSFTWGQGLYYYSNMPTIGEPPPDQYNPKLVTHSHKKFMESVRFPRIVSSHFNSFEHVYHENGGSNYSALKWWTNCLNNRERDQWGNWARVYNSEITPIDYSEVSHVVFQLTQWQRDNFIIDFEGVVDDVPYHCVWSEPMRSRFLRWLESRNLTLEQWEQAYIREGLENVKKWLQECESHGVKTTIFTWPSDYVAYIDQDPWLKERFLTFKYNDQEYRSIEDLMSPGTMQNKGYNPELTVKWDEESFAETPKDHHPSLKCHQVMAENIIRRIEEQNK